MPHSKNIAWQNPSFRAYADYMESEDFKKGIEELRDFAREKQTAIMCAEAVWWRCHRRIIADYLLHKGETVFHILGEDRLEPARMTASARPGPKGTLTYPASQ